MFRPGGSIRGTATVRLQSPLPLRFVLRFAVGSGTGPAEIGLHDTAADCREGKSAMLMRQGWSHRRLMYESERVLRLDVARTAHIRSAVQQVLEHRPRYLLWEADHSRLMRHVAEERRHARQALAMRRVALKLIHRRALIDHIRTARIQGEDRKALFRIFYGPKDTLDAILLEHRQYLLAASSSHCADILIDELRDRNGHRLLLEYERVYREYFAMYCRFSRAASSPYSSVLGPLTMELREQAKQIRERLYAEPPEWHPAIERRRSVRSPLPGMRPLTGRLPDLSRPRELSAT